MLLWWQFIIFIFPYFSPCSSKNENCLLGRERVRGEMGKNKPWKITIKLNYYYPWNDVEISRADSCIINLPLWASHANLQVHVRNPLRKSESIFLLNGIFKSGILMPVNRIHSAIKRHFQLCARKQLFYCFFVKIFCLVSSQVLFFAYIVVLRARNLLFRYFWKANLFIPSRSKISALINK